MSTPDTVTEAIEFLTELGYVDDLHVCAGGIAAPDRDDHHPVATAAVDYTFRFEGPSDPGDEMIVLGVTCGEWDRKGVIVSAFGPAADPEDTAVLIALTRVERQTDPRRR